MQESHEHYFEEESLYKAINRFEDMIKSKSTYYFDVCEFEIIIDYYLDQNDFNNASTAIDLGANQHPYSSQIHFRNAQLHINNGKPAKGLRILRDIEGLEFANSEFHLLKGYAFNILGKKEDATNAFEDAIQNTSEDKDDVIYSIAQSYIGTRRYGLAKKYLRLAHEINPVNTYVIHEMASLAERLDDIDASVTFYKKFLDIEPFADSVWLSLGILYAGQEKYKEAIEAFDYAIAIRPDNLSALFSKGNTLVNNEQYQDAISTYQEILDIEQNNVQACTYIGECFEKQEMFRRAVFYFKRAIELDAEYADAWYGLGMVNYNQEHNSEALNYFKKARKIDPENSDYWFMLGECSRKLGNLKESAEAFNRTLELDPNDYEAWLSRAELSFKDNFDKQGAIEILTKGYQFNHDVATYNYRLAGYYLSTNQKHLGLHYFEKGLTLNFDEHKEQIKQLNISKYHFALRDLVRKHKRK